MKKIYLFYFFLLCPVVFLKAQNSFPASGPVTIGWGAPSPFSLQVAGASRFQGIGHFGEHYDAGEYGKGIQIARAAEQGDNAFHLSFIRAGQNVSGMGFLRNSSTFAIQNGGNNATTAGIFLNPQGNVGIGLMETGYKLEVNGDGKVDGMIISSITNHDIGGTIALDNPAKTTPGTASSWRIFNMSGIYGNSLQFWAYDSQGCGGGLCHPRLTLMDNGNVGIGTADPGSYKLAVEGTIGARRLKITQQGSWADFVFHPDYKLPSLYEVEEYIKNNQHLPEIPSAAEVQKEGLDLGEMNKKLLQKIEELTLYLIEQQKQNQVQNDRIAELERLLKSQKKPVNQ